MSTSRSGDVSTGGGYKRAVGASAGFAVVMTVT
jgi:hypothetical protein